VEGIEEVLEAVAIGQQRQGDVRVVLWAQIRQHATPRHMPACILAVTDIPRTRSGKIVELAVRNVVHGQPVRNTDALANPEALRYFRDQVELQS